MKRNDYFCACECVNGYCPIAMDRANDWYSDIGYDVPKNAAVANTIPVNARTAYLKNLQNTH